jgi:hypothetical protein
MSKEVIIKITIPESEFKNWEEYPNNMIFALASLKRDLICSMINLGIENIDIETRLEQTN